YFRRPTAVVIIPFPISLIKIANHNTPTRGSMREFIIAQIDAYMRNLPATNFKKYKVARLQIVFTDWFYVCVLITAVVAYSCIKNILVYSEGKLGAINAFFGVPT